MDTRIAEITDLNDDLFPPWLDLYETTFPPIEKTLVSYYLKLLKEKACGLRQNHHVLALLDHHDELVGIAHYEIRQQENVALFWYLAITPAKRNHGLGNTLYRHVLRRLPSTLTALILEVEIPELVETQQQRDTARRRLHFYRRLGAVQLTGIHYLQVAGPHQPPLPMHILVHPLQPLNAQTAYRLCESIFGDLIAQTGPLALE